MNQHMNADRVTILSDLKLLGFSDYEARIYLAVLAKSPATAYEISNNSGVPRPNTYSVLKALAARKAVLPVSTNPIKYIPQPPESLFKSIAIQTGELCDTLADRLSAMNVDPGEQYVWDISGDTEVHGKVADMIAGATQVLWLKAEAAILHRHEAELRAATERGSRLVVILYGNNPDEFRFNDNCEIHEHEGSGFPMGFADNHFTLTVDDVETLTANVSPTVSATHTKNPAIVKMAISLLRHDYYMAEMFRALGPEIDAVFGPNLRSLRQHSYSDEQFAQFEERQEEHAAPKEDRTS
ncbi:MAG: TrmB family transcriptional regulator [Litoreibacter sp.]|nr:TrmB family transcriptional regulator [Litoreibacter sp.]